MKELMTVAALGACLGLGLAVVWPPSAQADSCCRHCKNSQPCGDSCIARDLKCHKPPGCACY